MITVFMSSSCYTWIQNWNFLFQSSNRITYRYHRCFSPSLYSKSLPFLWSVAHGIIQALGIVLHMRMVPVQVYLSCLYNYLYCKHNKYKVFKINCRYKSFWHEFITLKDFKSGHLQQWRLVINLNFYIRMYYRKIGQCSNFPTSYYGKSEAPRSIFRSYYIISELVSVFN